MKWVLIEKSANTFFVCTFCYKYLFLKPKFFRFANVNPEPVVPGQDNSYNNSLKSV